MPGTERNTTQIQLKTKTSPYGENEGEKKLSDITLALGEPLFEQASNTLIIGTSDNGCTADVAAFIGNDFQTLATLEIFTADPEDPEILAGNYVFTDGTIYIIKNEGSYIGTLRTDVIYAVSDNRYGNDLWRWNGAKFEKLYAANSGWITSAEVYEYELESESQVPPFKFSPDAPLKTVLYDTTENVDYIGHIIESGGLYAFKIILKDPGTDSIMSIHYALYSYSSSDGSFTYREDIKTQALYGVRYGSWVTVGEAGSLSKKWISSSSLIRWRGSSNYFQPMVDTTLAPGTYISKSTGDCKDLIEHTLNEFIETEFRIQKFSIPKSVQIEVPKLIEIEDSDYTSIYFRPDKLKCHKFKIPSDVELNITLGDTGSIGILTCTLSASSVEGECDESSLIKLSLDTYKTKDSYSFNGNNSNAVITNIGAEIALDYVYPSILYRLFKFMQVTGTNTSPVEATIKDVNCSMNELKDGIQCTITEGKLRIYAPNGWDIKIFDQTNLDCTASFTEEPAGKFNIYTHNNYLYADNTFTIKLKG